MDEPTNIQLRRENCNIFEKFADGLLSFASKFYGSRIFYIDKNGNITDHQPKKSVAKAWCQTFDCYPIGLIFWAPMIIPCSIFLVTSFLGCIFKNISMKISRKSRVYRKFSNAYFKYKTIVDNTKSTYNAILINNENLKKEIQLYEKLLNDFEKFTLIDEVTDETLKMILIKIIESQSLLKRKEKKYNQIVLLFSDKLSKNKIHEILFIYINICKDKIENIKKRLEDNEIKVNNTLYQIEKWNDELNTMAWDIIEIQNGKQELKYLSL